MIFFLSDDVNKINDDGDKNLLLLTIDLAGDANKDEKYETVSMVHKLYRQFE